MISLPSSGPGLRCALVSMLLAWVVVATPAQACDQHAIYTGSLLQRTNTGLFLSASEQYTDFGTIHVDGKETENPAGEWMKSSITQLVIGYQFTPRLAAEVNVPLISREYRRLEEGVVRRGDVGGIGDVSLLARFTPWSRVGSTTMVQMEMFAGLKVPTGDSDLLSEELAPHHGEDDDHGEDEHHDDHGDEHDAATYGRPGPRHGGEEHASAIHGHDLALGSGSVDGLFGLNLVASWKRLFALASVQYAVRGNGDYSYEYANDLNWQVGTGVYVLASGPWTASAGFVTSGLNKGRDHQQGRLLDDTALTSVFLGPDFAVTWSDAFHARVAVDLPLEQDTTGRQIVADYRIRAGLGWRF